MNIKPTDSELEILQILWQKEEATVKEINDILSLSKETGYTTTLKIMQIMFEKGLLKRDTSQRQHKYSPTDKQEKTQGTLLNRFIVNAFGGNAMNLVMQTLGNHTASTEELDEIKRIIKLIENKNKL